GSERVGSGGVSNAEKEWWIGSSNLKSRPSKLGS
ncbi:MAG: hypothetical protein ACI9YL_001624, partial [Luteibaculaceae bacterium]